MPRPKVCILRTAGTNCDQETAFAFSQVGAQAELVHINSLVNGKKNLKDAQILALPGGFTYGDDIAAGKILANELRYKLIDDLKQFITAGKLMIGICNGFQVLVKCGLLPGNAHLRQVASLVINDSGKFEDRWVYLKKFKIQKSMVRLRSPLTLSEVEVSKFKNKCVWTKGLPEIIYLPVAHGEGKFVPEDKSVLASLRKNGQIVFQYCNPRGRLDGYPDNPNGSVDNIAGICDETGRILGLMPHPERHISSLQHPRGALKHKKAGDGLQIFKNGVEYAKQYL